MFLKWLKNEVNQIWYVWLNALHKIWKIKYDTIEWRLELVLELLKYSDSLNLKLRDWRTLVDLKFIQNNLAKAYTYINHLEMQAAIIDWILTSLSFEFIKENNWKFDFSVIKDILNWEKEYKDFLVIVEKVTKNNAIWSFTWLSWEIYSWQWMSDLLKLNTEKYIDLLKWAKREEELLFVENNKELIKKEFNAIRNAYISIVKNMIDPNEKSKLLDLMQK